MRVVFGIAAASTLLAGCDGLFGKGFHLASANMEPAFQVDDYVRVPKFACGEVRPKRGDVVVYRGNLFDPEATFVSRVVGVPGDTVEFKDGRLLLNDHEVAYRPGPEGQTGTLVEVLPGGREHVIRTERPDGDLRNSAPVTLEGAYYVVGDNRGNSVDSRMAGPVPASNVCGLVEKSA